MSEKKLVEVQYVEKRGKYQSEVTWHNNDFKMHLRSVFRCEPDDEITHLAITENGIQVRIGKKNGT